MCRCEAIQMTNPLYAGSVGKSRTGLAAAVPGHRFGVESAERRPDVSRMQAAITAEFLEGIPLAIRQRLKLKPGTVMDFDEEAPFLKAVPASAPEAADLTEFRIWLARSTGLAAGKLTTEERLRETRGE